MSQRITAPALIAQKAAGKKIAMLTAYDATFARLLDEAGADILLVGDSLGMVFAGYDTTLPVTMDEMLYHCRAVVRGSKRAQVVGDMPFMSYQESHSQAIANAGRMLKEGGCQAVKLEGGAMHAELVRKLTSIGIPVMGHIGLLPQSVHTMGGFKVQGRQAGGSEQLVDDAIALEQAGAYSIVIEGVPETVAAAVTAAVRVPTIGIGAGKHCDGQVLVIYDLLGMNDSFKPKFVRRYEQLADKIRGAVSAYISDVNSGAFPSEAESFGLTSTKAAAADATPYASAASKPAK